MPGIAVAAPSATCTEADTGGLDISGTLSSTITITRTPAAGETFFATLQGGVTNSLLIVNGKTLFSGQTTGTRSFKGTGAPITIVYDIQGTGAMRFSCEEAPDPDPDPPDPDPDPGSTPAGELTKTIAQSNSPLGPLLPGLLSPAPLTGNPLGPLLSGLLGPACPAPAARDLRIAELEATLSAAERDVDDAETEVENWTTVLVAGALLSDRMSTSIAAANLQHAERDLKDARQRLEERASEYTQATRELEALMQCTPAGGSGSPVASQYFATPDAFAANSPLAAFAPFGGIGGTTMLFEDEEVRVFANGSASLFGGSGQTIGGRGNLSVGAARRVDDDTAIGGLIGVSAGRTQIGSDDTIGDFAAINALVAMSHELAENVRLDLGLAGGLAWNQIDIAGATGSFGSGQVAAFATLAGKHRAGEFVLTPSASLSASSLMTFAYTLSDGTAVAATAVSGLNGQTGLRIARPIIDLERDLLLEPFVDGSVGLGMSTTGGNLYASFGLGVTATRTDGLSLNLQGRLGGTAAGVWSASLSAGIGGTF